MRTVEAQMLFFQKKVTDLEAAADKANGEVRASRAVSQYFLQQPPPSLDDPLISVLLHISARDF